MYNTSWFKQPLLPYNSRTSKGTCILGSYPAQSNQGLGLGLGLGLELGLGLGLGSGLGLGPQK